MNSPDLRRGDLADCSQIQRDLWYAERLGDGTGTHLAFGLRVHGAVDPDAFRDACADLVSAHADLLSRFAERDGEPVRVRNGAAGSEVVELAEPGSLTAPFDIEDGPLVRFGLAAGERVTSVVASFHHLVFDGMSRDIAARDLIRCYEARLDGRRAALDPAPSYQRYVELERRALAAGPPPGWRETIDVERVALSDILDDGPAETVAEPMSVRLDAGRLAGLAKVAEAAGTTRHAALLATFAAALAGYAPAAPPAIGMPMSTRPAEFAEAAGVFVNEVPLSLAPEPDADFPGFLKTVSERVRAAFALRTFPVSALRRQAGLTPWRPSVIFGYRRSGLPPRLDMAGRTVEYQAVLPGYRTGAELELQLLDHGDDLDGQVGYDPRRFGPRAVRALLDHWYQAIDLAGAEPARPVRAWPVLDGAQRRRVAAMSTGPRAGFAGADTVHGLVAEQAACTPGAVAVRDGGRAVTYAELDRRADGLAHRLRAEGVGPEDRVLVCVPRSFELVAALLGTLRAGGCYVPLDPDDPPARRARMARDSGARVLVAEPGASPVPDFAGRVVPADASAEAAGPLPDVSGAHLAYAMYTSGSTGAPKAVMITHAALRNRLLWMQDAYRLTGGDRVLHKTAIGFDVSGWEIWWPLLTGATLVAAPPGAHRDTARLARLIRDEDVTVVHFVPSALRVFLDEPREEHTGLRLAVCSGEALTPDLVERFHDRLGGARLENLYGPTEAAIDVTAVTCPPGMDPVPIGRPVAGTGVRVLDAGLRDVPVGVTGEICLSGVQVARGYLGRPGLTAGRFVAADGGERLYRTGDLGRYRDDGSLEYLGRIDHQVKIRGRRVEPGEIEATLRAHPAVRHAAVIGTGGAGGETELAGYLVPAVPGERPGLDRWMSDALPSAMVPSALVWLDELPLTSSGKLDRRGAAAAGRGHRRVRGAGHRRRARPRRDLGRAVRPASCRRERRLLRPGRPLTAGHAYAQPAAGDLRRGPADARGLRTTHRRRPRRGGRRGERRMTEEELPLSFQQERLWFFHQLQPGSAAYNQSLGLRLTGPLDVGALRRAITEIVARHESLRTCFPARDGRPYQLIAEPRPVELEPVPESGAADDTARPFDIENGPLCRWRLYRRGEDDHLLLVVLHHLITDGWSFGVLTSELGTLYDAFRDGAPSPLPELPVQYADYALWQRDAVAGDDLAVQLGHWRAELDGIEPLDLPTDRPRPPEQTFNGDRHWFRIPGPLSDGLFALARSEGVTPFMALASVFQILLARAAGQDEVALGVPVAGRDQPELSGLIGYFVNTLVLRGDLSGDPTVRELLCRTRERAADGYRHLDIPLQWVTSELGYRRDLSRNALFDVMFAWQDVPASEPVMAGLEVAFDSPDATVNLVDLQLNCYPDDDGILGHIIYNRDLFDAASVERLAGRFTALLDQAVAGPGRRLSELAALGAGERELIEKWETGPAEAAGGDVGTLFEARVAERPGAVAVRHDGRRATYAELAGTASRVARWLRAEGVGRGDVVGVCLPRGIPLVAALLGVLRSGAAYLPLDPGLPAARREFMLADSGAALVLATPETAVPGARAADLDEVLRAEPEDGPWRPAHPRDLAYLIYTSGSTGTPKAVPIDHASLAARVGWMIGEYGLGPADQVLQFASTGFDTHVEEIYPCLLTGGRLLLTDPRQVDVPALLATEEGRETTVLDLPTPYWHELVRLAESGDLRVPDALRLVIIGADAADAAAVASWRRHVGRRLVNTYGPTEATVVATFADLTEIEDPYAVPPIGRPVAGVRAYVLDLSMRPAGIGVPGELYLGGTGVAPGYLGRPGLTAGRFVADPFGPPGERLYRTGDRVRWREGGRLEFLGRLDHQVKIRGFRVELPEVEAALREHPDVTSAVAVVRDGRLTGYVVGADGARVRDFAAGRLPEYMVPADIVTLAAIPMTSGGKPDRRALPAPDRTAGESRPPRGRTEEVLAAVWCEVLGLESVGAEDNFFEIGGDSIVSIQVVARARGRGVLITPRLLFRHQTVAALAAVAKAAPGRAEPRTPLVEGDVPLLPMQRWFLTRPFGERHHFGQSVLVSVADGTDAGLLERALGEIVAHHAALRARFARDAAGEWRQHVVAPGGHRPVTCERIDLSGAQDPAAALRERSIALKSGFDLGEPPLLRAALFALGGGEHRLLLAAHHLVVDAVSWHILLADLAGAYERLRSGSDTPLPEPTSSVRDHAENLHHHPDLLAEIPYWTEAGEPGHPVDVGGLDSTRTVTVGLDEESTEALLTRVPRAHGCRINDVLLTALARAWHRRTGEEHLLVDLEAHGREPLSDEVDLTRTVGWFTALHPVRLECGGDLTATLNGVRDTLRRVPGGGAGYGALRYLRGELPEAVAPAVGFNYLGRFEPGTGALFGPAGEDTGPDSGLTGPREHRIEVDGGVFGGRLSMTFGYSADLDSEAEVRALAEEYAEDLRRIVASAGDVRDRYPLSPLQQGLLFHAVGRPADGEYVVQVELRLRGTVDADAVRTVWRHLAARHTALRSSVHWRGLDEPVQEVHDDADVPVEVLDFRGDPEERLAAHLAADRDRGFELTEAPLLRVALARLAGDAYAMVVTSHHIVLDGWSGARLLEEFFTGYGDVCAGRPLDPAPGRPFRDYVTWLGAQDPAAAEGYWRERLGGFGEPTAFRDDRPGDDGEAPVDLVVTLDGERTARLSEFARREHLTMSTLLHAAWAVVLGRHTGAADVVFGSTVSGRPPELDGVESMVGLFINTLPVRFALPPERPARAFLRAVQDELIELREFEYSSLADAQRHAGTPAGRPLFDNILVVENYPVSGGAPGGGPAVEAARTRERTSYPLTVAVTLDAELLVRLSYRPGRWDEADVRRLAGHLFTVLAAFADEPDQALGRLPMLTGGERRHLVQECNDTGPGHAAPSLAALVERQVARTPDAPAVSFEGAGLTYAELNGRANGLAARLRSLGVRPGDVVAVCADRGLPLPVALLAVLKAGGAYLPLDPGYPRRRLEYMLADSGARVLLAGAGPAAEPGGDGVHVLPLDQDAVRRRRPGSGRDAGRPRLRDLHLGLDRPAEGRRQHAPRHRQPPAVDAGAVRPRPHRRRAAEDAFQLRRVGLGVLLAADQRRPHGAGAPGRPPRPGVPGRADRAGARHHDPLRALHAARLPRPGGPVRVRAAAPDPVQRRGAGRRDGAPRRRDLRRRAAQPLRADRGRHRRDLVALRPGDRPDPRPDRPADRRRTASTSWTARCARCPPAPRARSTSAAPGSRAATWAGRT